MLRLPLLSCLVGFLLIGSQISFASTTDDKPSEINPYFIYQCPMSLSTQMPKQRLQSEKNSDPSKFHFQDLDNKIHSSADNIDRKSDKVVLEGNVLVAQKGAILHSDKVEINQKTHELEATGGLNFHSDKLEVGSERLSIDLTNQKVSATDAHYRLNQRALHGQAQQLSIEGEGNVTLEDATFTSCPPGNEVWKFKADKIHIDTESGQGRASNLTLRIHDFPILYLPYIQFPASDKRMSGLLMPTFNNSNRNGSEFSQPYYWNIAENMDATITPRYMSKRGVQLLSQFRYLTEKSQGVFEAEFLNNNKGTGTQESQNRHRLYLLNHTRFNPHWLSDINFTTISDDNYYFDLGNDLATSSIYDLTRQASLTYEGEKWRITGLVSDDKTLNTVENPYQRLPQINWQSQFTLDLNPNNIVFKFDGEFTRFDRASSITANRLVLEPSLSFPIEWLSAYLRPSVTWNIRQYNQDDPNHIMDSNRTIATPIASFDAGIYLEKTVQLDQRPLIQTLEPRLFYLYVPSRNQQNIQLFDTSLVTPSYQRLFMKNRYSGFDRLGDANQISLGISSRILDKGNGEELLRIGLGQTYFLSNRKVSLATDEGLILNNQEILDTHSSPILADLSLKISDFWRLDSTFEWEPDSKRTQSSSFQLHYQPNDADVYNIGHRRRIIGLVDEVEQLDLSLSKSINTNWRFVGRWYQDLNQNRSVETLFGFEYDNCCWALRVVHRKFLDIALSENGTPIASQSGFYDKGIFIQFVLKGLSSLGSTSFLENSIQGYKDPYQ